MATRPTAEQAAIRILWLMVHKYGVRDNEIVHQGQFLVSFPGDGFRAEDFKQGAEYAVSKGWVQPSRMGTLPALRLTAAGFAAAPGMELEMQTLEARAFRLLAAIYERTRNSDAPVFVSELASALALAENEANAAWRYLSDKGLIKTFNIPYTARINANGTDLIEKAQQHPDQPPPGFGSVTYNTITVHHMQGSSIQQAGSNSSLVQSLSFSSQEHNDLRRALDTLEQHIDELGLDPSGKKKALVQIATIKAQLTDEPDPVIVKQAGKTLRNITEGAIAGLIAAGVQPPIWQFVGNVFARLFGG